MNIVDSSGWIEYFLQEKNASLFMVPIQDVEHLLVPSVCIYEVFKRFLVDIGEEAALMAVGVMLQGREVPIERTIAIEAARLSRELKLSMADSLIYAIARLHNATLWTQDEHFQGLEGVRYVEK